jgi:hypothetical protein
MTRLRWGLGGALVVAALLSAARALLSYLGHGLWLGSASVLLLALIAVVGYLSLGQARRRLEKELSGLAAEPPRGELISQRRAQLEALRARGVQPDRDALAAASEAEERARAYLGRYFVAVTVLVGLVGTFAGLMETLRTIGPLVSDGSTLQLLQAPLAGLDVTFGASVVGILVTLALALVQGDLVLAEELALTRLEERTTHVLVPELWPAAHGADERAVGELKELRSDLGRLSDRAGDRAAALWVEVTRTALDRLAAELGRGVTALQASLEQSTRANLDAVAQAAAASTVALAKSTQQQTDVLTKSTQQHTDALTKSTQQQTDVLTTSTERHTDALAQSTQQQIDVLTMSTEQYMDALAKSTQQQTEALATSTKQQSETLAQSTQMHTSAIAGTAQQHTEALAKSTQQQMEALTKSTQAHEGAIATAMKQQSETLAQSTQMHTNAIAGTAQQHTEALAKSTQQQMEALTKSTRAHEGAIATAMKQQSETLAQSTQMHTNAIAGTAQQHLDAIAQSSEATAGALRGSLVEAGTRLEATSLSLAQAVEGLRAVSDALSPLLAQLGPELDALAREVSLLSARVDGNDDPVIADELVRLGEGVGRLETLLRMSQA